MKKKNGVVGGLIFAVVTGWAVSLGYVNWKQGQSTYELEDYYKPSSEAVAKCAGAPAKPDSLLAPVSALSPARCTAQMIKACEESDTFLSRYGELEPFYCSNAKYHLWRAQEKAKYEAADLEERVSLAFAVAIMLIAAGALSIAAGRAATEREARKDLEGDADTPSHKAPDVHTLARLSGLVWGRLEARTSSIKRSFDEGRSITKGNEPMPPKGHEGDAT